MRPNAIGTCKAADAITPVGAGPFTGAGRIS
jgi:hypothetical protein